LKSQPKAVIRNAAIFSVLGNESFIAEYFFCWSVMAIRDASNRGFSESIRTTVLRFSLYTFGILLLAKLLPWVAQYGDVAVFMENGALEWMQFGLLVTTGILFLREAFLTPRYHHVFVLLACAAAFAAVREMDANLDRLVPWIGWKIGYLIILYAAFVTYSNAQTLKRQIMRIPHSRAFSLLWAGFIIAVPFAQLVGHGAFLHSVMGEDYIWEYNRIIEELGEFMGYVLLLIGGFELILQLRAARSGD